MRRPAPIPIVQVDIPSDTQTQPEPRRNGRVVLQPERFMFVGESLDLVPRKNESDPWTYNEVILDKDADSWQTEMEVLMCHQEGFIEKGQENLVCKLKKGILWP
ncbi:hypothetical protein ACS0TY_037017 [Phlomoides rotata]